MPVKELTKDQKKVLRDIEERIKEREKAKGKITETDLKLLYGFADQLVDKFGGFIQGLILFGSVARGKERKESDLDVLALVDDATWEVTPELISTWRIGVGRILIEMKAAHKLHITTLGIVQFWDAIRYSEPVILNVLRDGQPIIETGFFRPLKRLLELGAIKPSREAVEMRRINSFNFMERHNSRLLFAFDDLYWAAINAAHAVLLANDIVPASPIEVAEIFEKNLNKKVSKKDVSFLRKIVTVTKDIAIKKKKGITIEELKNFKKDAEGFVTRMSKLSTRKLKV